MCLAASEACFPASNGTKEKGGFGWLKCDVLPVHSEDEDENVTVAVPTQCCITAQYGRGKLLPKLNSPQCHGAIGVTDACSAAGTLAQPLFGALTLVAVCVASLLS